MLDVFLRNLQKQICKVTAARPSFIRLLVCSLLLAGNSINAQNAAADSVTATSQSADTPIVLIVLDLSLSMDQEFGDTTRIDAARQVFTETLARIPKSTTLGLRVFAHKGSGAMLQACGETELVIPFGRNTHDSITNTVNHRKPVGKKTPLAFALSRAAGDLAELSGERKIILVSDGIENCNGDPEGIAGQLLDIGITVDTIAIGEEAAFQLGRVALAGGGQFFLGNNPAALSEALSLSTGAGKMPELPSNTGNNLGTMPTAGSTSTPAPSALVTCIPIAQNDDAPTRTEDASSGDRVISKPPAPAPITLYLEIILDSSGSMLEEMEGRTRKSIARQVLAETVQSLDVENILVAFRAYGFDNSIPKAKETSCKNSELLIDFGERNSQAIIAKSQELLAYGYTPIAESLRLAGIDLHPYKDNHPTILLISDGKETCDGNPVAEIIQLQNNGIDVRVHVVGLALGDSSREQLKAVAHAGQGDYYDANNYTSLANSLKKVVETIHKTVVEAQPPPAPPVECEPTPEPAPPSNPEPEPEPEPETQGEQVGEYEPKRLINPISGGDDIDSAVTLIPAQYTFEEHLPANKKTWFFVPTQKGQRGIINITSQSGRLLSKDDGSVIEATTGEQSKFGFVNAFRVFVYQPGGKRLRRTNVNTSIHSSFTQFIDLTGKGFYFSIDGGDSPVQKDALFEVVIEEAGDYLPGSEASDKVAAHAVPIPVGKPIVGHIGLRDRADMYHLVGIPEDATGLTVNVSFPDYDHRFVVEVFDAAKAPRGRVQKFTHLTGEASLEFSLESGIPEYIIRINDGRPYLDHYFSDYMLEVTAH